MKKEREAHRLPHVLGDEHLCLLPDKNPFVQKRLGRDDLVFHLFISREPPYEGKDQPLVTRRSKAYMQSIRVHHLLFLPMVSLIARIFSGATLKRRAISIRPFTS